VRLVPGSNRIVIGLTQAHRSATALDADGKPLTMQNSRSAANPYVRRGTEKSKLENVPDGTYRALWTLNTQVIEGPFVRGQ